MGISTLLHVQLSKNSQDLKGHRNATILISQEVIPSEKGWGVGRYLGRKMINQVKNSLRRNYSVAVYRPGMKMRKRAEFRRKQCRKG